MDQKSISVVPGCRSVARGEGRERVIRQRQTEQKVEEVEVEMEELKDVKVVMVKVNVPSGVWKVGQCCSLGGNTTDNFSTKVFVLALKVFDVVLLHDVFTFWITSCGWVGQRSFQMTPSQ